MGQIILSNCKLWAGKYDMGGNLNAIAIDDKPDALPNTTFGCTAKSRKKGLPLITAALAGFFKSASTDLYFSNFILTNVPMTVAPEPTVGGPAYSFLSRNTEYKLEGMVGDMLKFNVKAENVGQKLIRGYILENGGTARIANGSGTALELGAISDGQTMFAALHVMSASPSDTLDVIIESDSLEAFTDDPQTRIAFTQVNLGAGGGGTYEWKTYTPAGGQVDTWWRISWTVAGVEPSFEFVVFAGIL